jgi:hypothetical protein
MFGFVGQPAKGAVLFGFDRYEDTSIGLLALPIAQELGITCYAAGDTDKVVGLGAAWTRVKALHDAGWPILSQGPDHKNYVSVGAPQLAIDYPISRNALQSVGLTNALDFFAYPFSSNNAATDAVLLAAGCKWASTSIAWNNHPNEFNLGFKLVGTARVNIGGMTVAQVKLLIDRAAHLRHRARPVLPRPDRGRQQHHRLYDRHVALLRERLAHADPLRAGLSDRPVDHRDRPGGAVRFARLDAARCLRSSAVTKRIYQSAAAQPRVGQVRRRRERHVIYRLTVGEDFTDNVALLEALDAAGIVYEDPGYSAATGTATGRLKILSVDTRILLSINGVIVSRVSGNVFFTPTADELEAITHSNLTYILEYGAAGGGSAGIGDQIFPMPGFDSASGIFSNTGWTITGGKGISAADGILVVTLNKTLVSGIYRVATTFETPSGAYGATMGLALSGVGGTIGNGSVGAKTTDIVVGTVGANTIRLSETNGLSLQLDLLTVTRIS